jgi:hypothetical protein
MLETQYRMHPQIAEYPSLRYYGGRLQTDDRILSTGSHETPYHADPSGRFGPVVLHNLEHGREGTDGKSVCNTDEVSE